MLSCCVKLGSLAAADRGLHSQALGSSALNLLDVGGGVLSGSMSVFVVTLVLEYRPPCCSKSVHFLRCF